MHILGQLIFGLGLFFIGMHQVGHDLRRLSGPSFRSIMARSTKSTWQTAFLGTIFGALMQSATAVTFITVSMVRSGLITVRSALPVIAWTNVGLTVLAFVATLDIHPLIAYVVGLSALCAALVGKPPWRAAAGVVLGIGFIFFGLETMGGVARPLVATDWFQEVLRRTLASGATAFVVGLCLAALLQSNTASTLLIITLAGVGAFDLKAAMMLVYGTNLGAIGLRMILALGLHGTSIQLVRFEDLFCLLSGLLMTMLFYAESLLGIPLVRAAVTTLSSDIKAQLACVFLLSNLIPALAITPFLSACQVLLARLWPPTPSEDAAKPKFLSTQALGDPSTALDLLEREIVHLMENMQQLVKSERIMTEELSQNPAIADLSQAISDFMASLTPIPMSAASESRLGLLREAMTLMDYLVEAVGNLGHTLQDLASVPNSHAKVQRAKSALASLFDNAVAAADKLDPKQIETLQTISRSHSPLVEEIRHVHGVESSEIAANEKTILLRLAHQFGLVAWIFHRMAKVLRDLAPPGEQDQRVGGDQPTEHGTTP
jgi:phosphate:Na+ symporter